MGEGWRVEGGVKDVDCLGWDRGWRGDGAEDEEGGFRGGECPYGAAEQGEEGSWGRSSGRH